MTYEVRKPFNTVNRRFCPGPGLGGMVSATDDLSPHTIKSLLAKNFIKEKVETASLSTGSAPIMPALLEPVPTPQPDGAAKK